MNAQQNKKDANPRAVKIAKYVLSETSSRQNVVTIEPKKVLENAIAFKIAKYLPCKCYSSFFLHNLFIYAP